MKKTTAGALLMTSLLTLTACGNADASSSYAPKPVDGERDGFDIDLTNMSSDMVYAQVYDMIFNGDTYVGKTVKARGQFSYYQEVDGREFYAVLVNDAAACCSQGIEFILDGEYTYPDDYPAIGTEITVTGTFNYYTEDFYTYCQLLGAEMTVEDASPEGAAEK